MPFELPTPLSGNTREDVARLWDELFRVVEQLRILEEELRRKGAIS